MERKLTQISNSEYQGIYSHLSITRIPLFTLIHYGLDFCRGCSECNSKTDQLSVRECYI